MCSMWNIHVAHDKHVCLQRTFLCMNLKFLIYIEDITRQTYNDFFFKLFTIHLCFHFTCSFFITETVGSNYAFTIPICDSCLTKKIKQNVLQTRKKQKRLALYHWTPVHAVYMPLVSTVPLCRINWNLHHTTIPIQNIKKK